VVTRHPIGLCVSVAIVAISGCVSAASAGKSEVYEATVCDLLMHRDVFDAKTISIRATFVGGLLEQAGIVDARCKDLGGIVVVNDANRGIENHLVNLAKAMQRARVTSTNAQLRTVSSSCWNVHSGLEIDRWRGTRHTRCDRDQNRRVDTGHGSASSDALKTRRKVPSEISRRILWTRFSWRVPTR
jgi:hypothetical protein